MKLSFEKVLFALGIIAVSVAFLVEAATVRDRKAPRALAGVDVSSEAKTDADLAPRSKRYLGGNGGPLKGIRDGRNYIEFALAPRTKRFSSELGVDPKFRTKRFIARDARMHENFGESWAPNVTDSVDRARRGLGIGN